MDRPDWIDPGRWRSLAEAAAANVSGYEPALVELVGRAHLEVIEASAEWLGAELEAAGVPSDFGKAANFAAGQITAALLTARDIGGLEIWELMRAVRDWYRAGGAPLAPGPDLAARLVMFAPLFLARRVDYPGLLKLLTKGRSP
jgi:hypothetical protein